MRHPLLSSHEEVRKRMMTLISMGLLVRRSGNLIFVCGGNKPDDLRPQFCAYLSSIEQNFQVFQPEYAMTNYFSDSHGSQLDLGDFEELVGDLSHSIVIFPEGPGSFAETGYFANIEKLAEKTILVLNSNYQGNDSFIMMGPARRYEISSKFSPNIQLDYENPDFKSLVDRIKRFAFPKTKKLLEVDSAMQPYDLFCLVYEIFDILSIATYEDLLFVIRSLTDGHPPINRLRDIASILVGAGYLKPIGDFGHYFCTNRGKGLISIREGFAEQELRLRLEIADAIANGEPELAVLLEGKADVA